MFESRREERAECTQCCRLDSHAGEKRWSTTALQDASRRRKLSERVRAFEMRRGWDAPSSASAGSVCAFVLNHCQIGAKHVLGEGKEKGKAECRNGSTLNKRARVVR